METFFKLTELYHTIMCKEPHDLDECEFYYEDLMPDKWSTPCHLQWLTETMGFQKRSGLTPEELLKRMNSLINSFSLISITVDDNKYLREFVERLIALYQGR